MTKTLIQQVRDWFLPAPDKETWRTTLAFIDYAESQEELLRALIKLNRDWAEGDEEKLDELDREEAVSRARSARLAQERQKAEEHLA